MKQEPQFSQLLTTLASHPRRLFKDSVGVTIAPDDQAADIRPLIEEISQEIGIHPFGTPLAKLLP